MTQERRETNYGLFISRLNALGIDTTELDKDLGDKIKNAPYCTDNKLTDNAYDGALLEVVIRHITTYAVKINELLPENKKVDKNTLVKVSLLHQLSKAVSFIPNDNDWEKTNRGILYKFTPSKVALKMGMKSLLLCQKYGISFSDEEIEAMTIMDRETTDNQATFYSTTLSQVIKQANDLTFTATRNN